MSTAGDAASRRAPRGAGLWLPVFAGPSAWFIDLNTRYFLVESGVAAAHPVAAPCVGVACLLIAAGASARCWRVHGRLAAEDHGSRFVALIGCVLSGYSALVIAAMLLPHLFFDGGARL